MKLTYPTCVKIWQTCFDGKLLDCGFDSPKSDESVDEFVMRVRRSCGLDKYTSLKSHRWISTEYGIASVQLVFCK